MRVNAIQSSRVAYSAPKFKALQPTAKRKDMPLSNLSHDSVLLKSNTIKGAGIGTAFGLLAMAALSAVSGGVAAPIAYGLYAAAFGTAGGIAGKALDNAETTGSIS